VTITRLADPEVLQALRRHFQDDRAGPAQIPSICTPDAAREVARELIVNQDWAREYFLREFLGPIRACNRATFDCASGAERLVQWEKLELGSARQGRVTANLLRELSEPACVDAMSSIERLVLGPPTIKVVRYRRGDFFAPHDDGGRGIGVVLLFVSPRWRAADGGIFTYQDREAGTTDNIVPQFNLGVVMRYRAASDHSVVPVSSVSLSRFTIIADYAPLSD